MDDLWVPQFGKPQSSHFEVLSHGVPGLRHGGMALSAAQEEEFVVGTS